MFDLSGRVALVTGGSRGLGRVIAGAYAAAGADVVVASRDLESCEAAAAEISAETGRRALPLAFHVGHWERSEPLLDRVVEEFGRLDVLVNNAGMSPLYDGLDNVTEALWDKVFDVNLKGPFRLAALAGTRMAAAGGGSIVNVSSMSSHKPRAHNLPYAAAKAGLNTMTVGMAHAFGPAVRVNAIVAGTFLTDVSKAWDAEAFARRAAGFALGRGGQPHEVAGIALYLASDAGSYTTGSLITVDGGQP
ncbi:SDR family NAD(P)-dependent oxidoreductase [Actinokineospora pegani]|uniref:SDR family NAD(P)-dependent oxidoreductase n=1 Tax=Actinokineospora pegani TaxID=2654637 RepID=UPI0012EAD323|nr:glucose 1-dehydrogenase [Actinokineospora pegani]